MTAKSDHAFFYMRGSGSQTSLCKYAEWLLLTTKSIITMTRAVPTRFSFSIRSLPGSHIISPGNEIFEGKD
jgi:hypothetical protein